MKKFEKGDFKEYLLQFLEGNDFGEVLYDDGFIETEDDIDTRSNVDNYFDLVLGNENDSQTFRIIIMEIPNGR